MKRVAFFGDKEPTGELPGVLETERAVMHGSTAWLELRDTIVTASDMAAIMGRNPYKSREDVLKDKLTGARSVMTDKMAAGLKWEPAILGAFQSLTGFPTVGSQELLLSARLPGLGATCDGFCRETKDRIALVEAKNLSRGLLDGPPDYYVVQVLTQLFVTGLDTGYLMARFGKNGCRIWKLEQDPSFVTQMTEATSSFLAELQETAL